MKKLALAAALFAALSPANAIAADDDNVVNLSKPSDADIAAARAKAEEIVDILRADDPAGAVRAFAEGSKLIQSRAQEIEVLAGKANSTITLYGPIDRCILSSYSYTSELQINFTYVCRHDELLVRWQMRLVNLPRGWLIADLQFNDRF